MLLNYEKDSNRDLKKWLSEPNSDSFTALHFAAYRGSIRSIELLIKYGA